jgi:hypothetical protein
MSGSNKSAPSKKDAEAASVEMTWEEKVEAHRHICEEKGLPLRINGELVLKGEGIPVELIGP